jgi:hypothetical protein
VYIVRRPAGGPFGPPSQVAGQLPAPDQLVLPRGGATVVRIGATMLVEPAGASSFTAPQELGGAQQFDLAPPDALLAATTAGEVIASVMDNSGNELTEVLARGASAFAQPQAYPSFYPLGGPAPVASDGAGGAFMADESTMGRCGTERASTVVAYRPPASRFRVRTPLHCRLESVPQEPASSAIAAAGRGRAVLATLTGTFGHYQVVVQTRRHGRFDSPQVLTRFTGRDPYLYPPVIGAGGRVTIGWSACNARGRHCMFHTALGSLPGGRWRAQSFRGSGTVGDGYVALLRCAASCTLRVAYAAGRSFTAPRVLARHVEPVYPRDPTAAAGGVIVWESPGDGLLVATRSTSDGHFGAVHRLAGEGTVQPGAVNWASGPDGQALVTWRQRDGTARAAAFTP